LYPRPSCRPAETGDVEILWTIGANPVENRTTKIFMRPDHAGNNRDDACGRGLREALRLIVRHECVKSTAFARSSNTPGPEQTPCDRSSLRRNHLRSLVPHRSDRREQPLARTAAAAPRHADGDDAVLRPDAGRGCQSADEVAGAGTSTAGRRKVDDVMAASITSIRRQAGYRRWRHPTW
jgi:hypothetical protein